MKNRKCDDCKGPLPDGRKAGYCEKCKAFIRSLNDLHGDSRALCKADRMAKPERVEVYAAKVAAGLRIFE